MKNKDEKKSKVILGVGSNLGNREKNLYNASLYLQELLDDFKVASIYETMPLYVTDQPKFLNTVISGYTKLAPDLLLKKIERIEVLMGRNKKNAPKMGPRYIDIDILLYDNEIVISEKLTIPHLRIKEREFVLKPLIELEPEIKDPVEKKLYADVLPALPDQGVVYYSSWTEIVKRNSP